MNNFLSKIRGCPEQSVCTRFVGGAASREKPQLEAKATRFPGNRPAPMTRSSRRKEAQSLPLPRQSLTSAATRLIGYLQCFVMVFLLSGILTCSLDAAHGQVKWVFPVPF